MKFILLSFGLLFFLNSKSQDCKNFYLFQQNKTSEITHYNKKGKEEGKQLMKPTEVKTSGGIVTSKINVEMTEKKGKKTLTDMELKCDGGKMMMNMKMFIPQEQMKQMEGEVFSDFYLEYPGNLRVGNSLPDGSFTMDFKGSGMDAQMTINITDRKIDAKEKVTTPAGTWDCYKISYSSKMSIKTMGINIPNTHKAIEWYAPGFGIIKSENKYGSSVLTALN